MVMLKVMIFDIFDSIGYNLYGWGVALYEKQSIWVQSIVDSILQPSSDWGIVELNNLNFIQLLLSLRLKTV